MNIFDLIINSLKNGGCNDKGCDWFCDECGEYMNNQPGFSTSDGEWTCTECGAVNDVSEDNILSYDDDDDGAEYLDVYDAADIWHSHGEDEDYMFGYTREELEEASK